MTMGWGLAVDIALDHSQTISVALFAAYIAYEIRLGVIRDVQENNRVIGIGLYHVIERDEELDETAFRDALWDEGDNKVLQSDLTKGD